MEAIKDVQVVVTVMSDVNAADAPTEKPPLPDVNDVLDHYGQTAEIVGVYEIPGEGDLVEEVDENGVVKVTKTTRVLVRVTEAASEEDETGAEVALRPSKVTKEENNNKDFYKQMERERRKIIAVQRRSTPDDVAHSYLSAVAFANGEMHSIGEDNEPGEVDSQSILDNKEHTKKFLTNKMLEGTQNSNNNNNDSKTMTRQASPAKETPMTTANKIENKVLAPVPAALAVTNGNGDIRVAEMEVPMIREEPMRLVEARPCFIEQTPPSSVLKAVSDGKKDKSASTLVTESKIAQEIEECRLREEELKLQRTERYGRFESTGSVSSEDSFRVESQLVITNGYVVESEALDLESPRLSSPMSSLRSSPVVVSSSPAPADEDQLPQRRIKVRPLSDDSDEEDRPAYIGCSESAVEREIRVAREREEELRKEKSLRQVAVVKAPPVALASPLASAVPEDLLVVDTPKGALAPDTPKNPLVAETPISPPVPEIGLASSNGLTVTDSPVAVPIENGHATLMQKRSVSMSLTITPPKEITAARASQQNLASARLHQEVHEVIQKELALKESGCIATTSQDRTDEKVINVRQYRVETGGNLVPQSAPAGINMIPSFRDAGANSPHVGNGFTFAPTARIPNSGMMNGAGRPALHRSATTKGMMARFIASRGKMTALPVFVPKVSKPTPLEAIADPPATPPTEVHDSSTPAQEMSTKEDNVPLPNNEQEQVKPKLDQKIGYRRNFSMVENKILHELRDMKAREEELRRQRLNVNGSVKGSLESLLDSEDSGETNGHVDVTNGIDGIFSFAKDYDSDNSLENQTHSQDIARKRNYLVNHWEERIQQNEI